MSKQSSNADSHPQIQSDCDEAGYEEYCREMFKQRDRCLQLIKRIDASQGDRENIRKTIVEYCATYGIAERTFWYYLVCYAEERTFSLDEQPDAPFGVCDKNLRAQIPSLILQIPHPRLAQFKKLLCFTTSFLDRMNYLFDWLLKTFLESTLKGDSATVDDETPLDEELLFACENIIINTIGVMQRSLVGHESDEEEF